MIKSEHVFKVEKINFVYEIASHEPSITTECNKPAYATQNEMVRVTDVPPKGLGMLESFLSGGSMLFSSWNLR